MKAINPTLCPSLPSLLSLPSFSPSPLEFISSGEKKGNNDCLFTLHGIFFSFGTDLKIIQVFKNEKTGLLWLAFNLCVNCFGIHCCCYRWSAPQEQSGVFLSRCGCFLPCTLLAHCVEWRTAWTCQPLLNWYCFNAFSTIVIYFTAQKNSLRQVKNDRSLCILCP